MAEAKAQPSFGGQLAGIANALKRGDIALALGVTAILVVLILPLPAWLLDLSLAMSMTLSVLILMTAIGRAHVSTPVTNAHLVCRILIEKKKHQINQHSRLIYNTTHR